MTAAGASPDLAAIGAEAHALAARLFPLYRSVTGDGVRETLRIMGERIPIAVREVPSGSAVFDWTVPPEWNVREAWIADVSGRRVVDLADSTLHLVAYSTPQRRRVSLAELREHLHSLPDQPDRIPFRNTYYQDGWGFCVTHEQYGALTDPEYDVVIDSTLAPGALTYGECVIPGETTDEILVSAHLCHPSLANDNLSGLAVATALAEWVASAPRRHTVRFVFAPATIGAIAWLSDHRDDVRRIRHGFTLACVGDASPFHYKRTIGGNATIDRAVARVLADAGAEHRLLDFAPYGYDERQYNSPGFRLPVGGLSRGLHGTFPEYHTSADHLDFIQPRWLGESFDVARRVIEVLEAERTLRNTSPFGEPQLGRRGLYRAIGGGSQPADTQMAMLWLLSLGDGAHSLLDVCDRAGIAFEVVDAAARRLEEAGLLVAAPPDGGGDAAAASAASADVPHQAQKG